MAEPVKNRALGAHASDASPLNRTFSVACETGPPLFPLLNSEDGDAMDLGIGSEPSSRGGTLSANNRFQEVLNTTTFFRNVNEVINQAFRQDEDSNLLKGVKLETVIPHNFNAAKDTIVMRIPRGYGAMTGKTMEVSCERFVPGSAVAISVPADMDPSSSGSSKLNGTGSHFQSEISKETSSTEKGHDTEEFQARVRVGDESDIYDSFETNQDERDVEEKPEEDREKKKKTWAKRAWSYLRKSFRLSSTSPNRLSDQPSAPPRLPSVTVVRSHKSFIAQRPDLFKMDMRSYSFSSTHAVNGIQVQRADSISFPTLNNFGGRAFIVIPCVGLNHYAVTGSCPYDFGSASAVIQQEQDSDSTRRYSLDMRVGMPRMSNSAARKRCAVATKNSSAKKRRGRHEHIDGLTYLDEFPFDVGGYANVYRGAYNRGGDSIAVAIKVTEYDLLATEVCEKLSAGAKTVQGGGEKGVAAVGKGTLGNGWVKSGDGKVRKPSSSSCKSLAVAAANEADIMSRLKHPNILAYMTHHTGPVRGQGREEGDTIRWQTTLVAEFCIGASLSQILREPMTVIAEQRINTTAAKKCIIRQIASGMGYLHSQYVVHGDLKASNVLLHPTDTHVCPGVKHHEDSNWVVKIADFGTASVLTKPHTCKTITNVSGTISHMAPELLNDNCLSFKSDVYSFAILLWEIAAEGARAFAGVPPHNIVIAVVQQSLRPSIPDGTDSYLEHLVTKCWSSDPKMRPSFDEVVEKVDHEWYVDDEMSGKHDVQYEGCMMDCNDESILSSELPFSTRSLMSMEVHDLTTKCFDQALPVPAPRAYHSQ